VRDVKLPNERGFIGLIERAFLSNANANLQKRETASEMDTYTVTKTEFRNKNKDTILCPCFYILLDLNGYDFYIAKVLGKIREKQEKNRRKTMRKNGGKIATKTLK
jgi:hypothetical protein